MDAVGGGYSGSYPLFGTHPPPSDSQPSPPPYSSLGSSPPPQLMSGAPAPPSYEQAVQEGAGVIPAYMVADLDPASTKQAVLEFLHSLGFDIFEQGDVVFIVKERRDFLGRLRDALEEHTKLVTHSELGFIAERAMGHTPPAELCDTNQFRDLLFIWLTATSCEIPEHGTDFRYGTPADYSCLGKYGQFFGEDRLPIAEVLHSEALNQGGGAAVTVTVTTAMSASTVSPAEALPASQLYGGLALGLTGFFHTIPRLIREAQNWDQTKSSPTQMVAFLARIVVTGLVIVPPIATIAGMPSSIVSTAMAAAAGGTGLEHLSYAAKSTYDVVVKYGTYLGKEGPAAAFAKREMLTNTITNAGTRYVQALTQLGWAAVHGIEAAGGSLPSAYVPLIIPTFVTLATHFRRSFQGVACDIELLHQAMRGQCEAVLAMEYLIRPFDEEDEQNIIDGVKSQRTVVSYVFGGQRLSDAKELALLQTFLECCYEKGSIGMEDFEKATMLLQQIYSWDFRSFRLPSSVLTHSFPALPQLTWFLLNVYRMRQLDKSYGFDSRGLWNCNAVYEGCVEPLIGLLVLKRNPPSTVVDIPDAPPPPAPAEQVAINIPEDDESIPLRSPPPYLVSVGSFEMRPLSFQSSRAVPTSDIHRPVSASGYSQGYEAGSSSDSPSGSPRLYQRFSFQ